MSIPIYMMKNPYTHPSDLYSPQACIKKVHPIKGRIRIVELIIQDIDEHYLGLTIDTCHLQFSLKRSIAFFGIDSTIANIEILNNEKIILLEIALKSYNSNALVVLKALCEGLYVGKLFALDPRRRVASGSYLERLLDRVDADQEPLFSFGKHYHTHLEVQKKQDYCNINLPIVTQQRLVADTAHSIPLLIKGLERKNFAINQVFDLFLEEKKLTSCSKTTLYKSIPFSIKSLFAVVNQESLEGNGISNSANLFCPLHAPEGLCFIFHDLKESLKELALTFYTQEPFREQFSFSQRDSLNKQLASSKDIFKVFNSVDDRSKSAIFIAKGTHLKALKNSDWIESNYKPSNKLCIPPSNLKESFNIQEFIKNQPFYPIFKAIDTGGISSEGVLFCNYFPAPIMKQYLLHERVRRYIKAIYFKTPSFTHGQYFSTDDRALLQDLAKANIAVYWVDFEYKLVLQYIMRQDNNSGMFIPKGRQQEFREASVFGIYGSSRLETNLKLELLSLFKGLKEMKKHCNHQKINPETPFCIMTGGGPGIMNNGNWIASKLNILSCGNAVDFRKPHQKEENAEPMNPYLQAKMTYRLEQIIIRQSDFNVDFPIFFQGGIGTDLELCLEKLLMQIEAKSVVPILLFGSKQYWQDKISSQYKINLETGTIKGSEWISNSIFCVQTAQQALDIYHKFFTGSLKLGKDLPANPQGFTDVV
jgi:predicted Rossmann-fold nucleotide-binding protein